jgi:hypothetical protein
VIADDGYTGKTEEEKKIFSVRNTLDDPAVKEFKSRAKPRHEQFNERLKHFKVLKERFVHGVQKHKRCFIACAVLCQYEIEDISDAGEPLHTL